MSAEKRLAELGVELPPAAKPVGVYKPFLQVDNLVYVSGHGPLTLEKTIITGRVGADASVEEGYAAARQTGLAILSTLKANLGSLDRIKRVVKLLGLVCCVDDFHDQPKVINGCSELFVEVFGEEYGAGVRSAVGTNALPVKMMVEIEGIFELA